MAGLGAFAIPGIGPVVGVGWLATMLAGAAAGGLAGGLIGALTEAGIDERDAHVYAEGVRRGGTMVIARVDEAHAEAAQAVLGKHGHIDVSSRRTEYEAEGWSGFDEANYSDDPEDPRRLDQPIIPSLPR